MDHPHIAKVLDAGTTERSRPYFVMELVKGVPITRFCDERRLDPRARMGLFIRVCQAVQHAHQKGVIHRDLKPSNVLVGIFDGQPWPKVIDFGVAKATKHKLTESTLFTGFGAVVGTPEYMSPEQAQLDNLDIDTRSDIYSLGVLLYELLTGTTPLDRKQLKEAALLEVLRAIREEEPQRPSCRLTTTDELPAIAASRNVEPRRLSGLVRGELDWIVMKAIDKDRRRRYATAGGLADDVSRYLEHEPVEAGPPSSWYWIRKFAQRNRAAMAAVAIGAAALVSVAVLAVLYAQKQHHFAVEQARARNEITVLASQLGKEKESLRMTLAGSNRLLAIRNFDRGQDAFEKGQIGPGLLWMIESWRSAIAAGDPAWQHAARANLAAWQSDHPRLKAVLSHSSPVEAAAFSPDGKMIVTGGDDHKAQVWDAATARPVGPSLRHEGEVASVAFSPDGKTILTGSSDKTARRWDTATGRQIGSPLQHGDVVTSVAFSPDGKTLITGCGDGKVRRWDALTGRPLGLPFQHHASVVSVAFSPDGKTVLTVSIDLKAWRWDAMTGQRVGGPFGQHSMVRSLATGPDGRRIITGSQDGSATLWDAATGQLMGALLNRHTDRVRGVAFSPDGKMVLTASTDRTAQLWDARSRQPLGRPMQHEGPVVGVSFSPDGKTILTVSSDRTARIWDADLARGRRVTFLDRAIGPAVFNPDGKTIISSREDGTVQLWDMAARQFRGASLTSRIFTRFVAVRPDGKILLTHDSDGRVQRWDASSGRPIGPPLINDLPHTALAFSPDGKTILTGGQDRNIRLWDAATGGLLHPPFPQPGTVDAVAFCPDGSSFVTGYDIGAAQLWNLASLTPIGQPFPHPGCVSAVAFSPDGKILVTGCEDSKARLWDVSTRALLVQPLRHQRWVWSVAFSPDGRTVLTGSDDGTARLWDVATGVPLGPVLRTSAKLEFVAFSPDGKHLLTSGWARTQVFPHASELPDDLDRVLARVETLTGLTLDAQQGSIRVLDNAAWLETRERLNQLGGPPETDGDEVFAPILPGIDAAPPDPSRTELHWQRFKATLDEFFREWFGPGWRTSSLTRPSAGPIRQVPELHPHRVESPSMARLALALINAYLFAMEWSGPLGISMEMRRPPQQPKASR